MLFEDINWLDVESYLAQDDRVVLLTGACEQHSHLSLLTDIRIPLAVAQAACREEKILIAPPLPYGISPYFTAYPGTISLRPETFAALLRDLIGGLFGQGFRRMLISNGHGGNTGILINLISELSNLHEGLTLRLYEWWRHPAINAVAEKAGLAQHHANWSENFPFTRVGPVPEGEKEAVTIPPGTSAQATRAALGDGSYGGAFEATDEVMVHMFDAAVKAMIEALQEL